ncbi:MAG TPA: acetyl-CoA carboxylase biotin carboxyl carrier protein [Nitrospirales bacterium]|nr:acetyl-CoA carboxylase biotin carboxyl carrier protein [Nitrospirales bacterium]
MKRRAPKAISKAKAAGPKPAPDALIDPKVLHELVELFQAAGVSDLEVERNGLRVRLRREEPGSSASVREVTVPVSDTARASSPSEGLAAAQAGEGLVTVTSPIVGVFYRSASPENDPYVEEGSYVKKGQVLCIVEAMKLMNEIESEMDGRVIKLLVENAKPVEYGEPLFLIDPMAGPEG